MHVRYRILSNNEERKIFYYRSEVALRIENSNYKMVMHNFLPLILKLGITPALVLIHTVNISILAVLFNLLFSMLHTQLTTRTQPTPPVASPAIDAPTTQPLNASPMPPPTSSDTPVTSRKRRRIDAIETFP